MTNTPRPQPAHRSARRLTLALAGCGLLLALAGCNTMEGVGQDTQKAGKAIENSADRNQ